MTVAAAQTFSERTMESVHIIVESFVTGYAPVIVLVIGTALAMGLGIFGLTRLVKLMKADY